MSHETLAGSTQPARVTVVASWLFMGTIAVVALSILGAAVPARFRLIGLFALAYGLLAGWTSGAAASFNQFRRPRPVFLVTFGLVAVGLIGMTWSIADRRAEELRRQHAEDPRTAALLEALQDTAPQADSSESDQPIDTVRSAIRAETDAEAKRLAAEATFAGYLRHRVSALGQWSTFASAAFWSAEVLIASLAGAWLAARHVQSELPMPRVDETATAE